MLLKVYVIAWLKTCRYIVYYVIHLCKILVTKTEKGIEYTIKLRIMYKN